MTDEERARVDETLQRQVVRIQNEIDILLIELGYRARLATYQDGNYWDMCRDTIIQIKNKVNSLMELLNK